MGGNRLERRNDMEEFASLLTNYAFPVVVSLYLLTRLEKRIGDLEKAINNFGNQIEEMKEELRYGNSKRNR